MAMESVGSKMCEFFLAVGAPYVVYIPKHEVQHYLSGVDPEGMQLCLSGGVSRGRVYYQRG